MRRFCACLLLFVLILAARPSWAELSLAVVDVQALLTESNAAKNVQEQLQKRKEDFLNALSAEEQKLRAEEQKLNEERADLGKEEFAQKAKAFEEKLIETRQMAQSQKRSLDEASAQALSKLRAELYKIVQEIADEKNYSVVIARQSVVVGEKSIDITEQAMERLNNKVTEIKIEP